MYKEAFLQNFLRQEGWPCSSYWVECMSEPIENKLKGPLNFAAPYDFSIPHDMITKMDIFDLHSYQLHSHKGGTMYLRCSSPEAKTELENAFIFTNSFGFSCPKALGHFLNSLSPYQRCLLRSITIRLFACVDCSGIEVKGYTHFSHSYRAWTETVDHLPATLQSITFGFGKCGTLLANPLWWPEDFPSDNDTKKALQLLEILTKKAQRQAPKAQISLAELGHRHHMVQELLQSVLDEVDAYSKDFEEWSVRSWRDGITQGAEP